MNYNEYMEVINGELTFKEIATTLVAGKTIGIGWTDEVFTHFDIIFKLGLDVKEGSFQRGIRPDYLFVSIIDYTSFGFRADSIKEGSYIEEKELHMKLREANFQVERKNNELDKLLKDKELLECLVEPKGTDYTKVVVDGGKHTNILDVYVALKDLKKWKNLDERIQRLQSEIQNLIDWIDNELKILDKYDEIEESIIYYKEISIKKYTWQEIANKVHYSKDYCRKIYKRYKKKRNI